MAKNKIKKKKSFKFIGKQETYNYLKKRHKEGKRIVVSRFGDGEYFHMVGVVKGRRREGGHCGTEELTRLLNESIKKKDQLICLPNQVIITQNNLYLRKANENPKYKLANKIGRYIISNSDHDLYGQVRWRDIDLISYNSEFVTEFFVGKTLVITRYKEVCEKAFRNRKKVMVDVYEIPRKNAASDYKNIKSDLISISKEYKNIVFAAGPLANILIADLIDGCKAHLIDIGSSIGVVIAPYSSNYYTARSWPGSLRRADSRRIIKCSDDFFKTLNKKLDLSRK